MCFSCTVLTKAWYDVTTQFLILQRLDGSLYVSAMFIIHLQGYAAPYDLDFAPFFLFLTFFCSHFTSGGDYEFLSGQQIPNCLFPWRHLMCLLR
jgi:hypothetical protein